VTTEVQWSDLQRDPKGVARMADEGDVRLRRRDGVPLLLTREDRAGAAEVGSLTAARTLRNVLVHLPDDRAADVLRDEFPWIDQLPPADVRAFVTDFSRAVQASAELGDWTALALTITEWKSTAIAAADHVFARTLTEPIDEGLGAVPSPHAR